ncbi:MAG: polysaccharide deacetylase family protein [Armatimonadetes bacterium]|nr:polysaccharide deacetylase family protein [Armatimonadota bacterium]
MGKRFYVTVDDPGGLIQDLAIFERARRFFDQEAVPATFFVVPRGEGDWQLDRQPDWLAALQGAEADGHDCQLHGLDHKGCEFGPIPDMIVALGGDLEAGRQRYRDQYWHMWRPDAYRDKLQIAIGIFAAAFGRQPLCFRTGALSQEPVLYEVVADLGMKYVSNKVTDPRGWRYIIEQYDDPGDWDPEVPSQPYWLTDRVINLPIISEYAWYLTPEKIAPHLALAVEDMGRVYAEGDVFLLVCHVQCVGAEDGLSQELLRRLFRVARQEHDVTFETVRDLVQGIEEGSLPVLGK